jgi:hypothetical protein
VFFQGIVTKYRASAFFVVQSAPFTHKNWLGDQWI